MPSHHLLELCNHLEFSANLTSFRVELLIPCFGTSWSRLWVHTHWKTYTSTKELFITHTHGKIEKSYCPEWVSNPRPSDLYSYALPSVCDEQFFVRIYIYHSDDVILYLFENYWLARLERLDHQVAQIAQSVEHRSTSPRVLGSIPTPGNKIFQSFHECVRWTILC